MILRVLPGDELESLDSLLEGLRPRLRLLGRLVHDQVVVELLEPDRLENPDRVIRRARTLPVVILEEIERLDVKGAQRDQGLSKGKTFLV